MMARHKSLHHKSDLDDGYIKSLKETITDMEKEQKEMEEKLGAAREHEKAAKDLEQKLITANSRAKAHEKILATMGKLLEVKDEKLVMMIGQLSEARARASQANAEREEMANELSKYKLEQSNLKTELEKLRVELKSSALQRNDEKLKESASKAAEEFKTRFQDFVQQMQDTMNEYFLEGWEEVIQNMKVDSISTSYHEVPFPNPHSAIPPFSFDRPSQTPIVDIFGLEKDLEEGEVKVESSEKAEDAPATSSRAGEGLDAEDQATLTNLVKSFSSGCEERKRD